MSFRRGFGLYVHWPFCQAKCPYCDFNSHVATQIDQTAWADAFEREIARVAAETSDMLLGTVFFGGGTPSLMAPETVDRILGSIRKSWMTANDLEITLEANPTSFEARRFAHYADLGINRVSIGVQSLRDEDLKRLGRLHDAKEARSSVRLANELFGRVSFDLIYARQHQTMADWRSELEEALELANGHLSLYQLTIEDGTAFGDRFSRGKLAGLPDEGLAADMYELTQEMTELAGVPAYEISNHARPGDESKHNLIYWRNHDWLGIGPGAHGRFTRQGERIATENHLGPSDWMEAVDSGSGECLRYTLSQDDEETERVMMGMRLREGLSKDSLLNYFCKINDLIESGLLNDDGSTVSATRRGQLVLNSVIKEILA